MKSVFQGLLLGGILHGAALAQPLELLLNGLIGFADALWKFAAIQFQQSCPIKHGPPLGLMLDHISQFPPLRKILGLTVQDPRIDLRGRQSSCLFGVEHSGGGDRYHAKPSSP
ncbi:MAG TPA: hypothetical protein VLV49_05870 [Terriglobales bacterium]|nr:hypothetical protein [Terriglobales bacterium]